MLTLWTGSSTDPVFIKPRFSSNETRGLYSFRTGGVSSSPYATLNVGLHVGDQVEHVLANRRRCAAEMASELDDWVFAEQVHGTGVAVVTRADRGSGTRPDRPPIAGVDALSTDEPGLTLAVVTADCVPLLMFARRRRAVAAAHSGWRGTVGGIAGRVLDHLREAYGSRPEDVEVWLGPSIRSCCYEVDDKVAAAVRRSFGDAPLRPRFGRPGKYWLSLQACIRQDLIRHGIRAEDIHDTGVCTACRTRHLFSHRAEHGRTGRLLGAIQIRP